VSTVHHHAAPIAGKLRLAESIWSVVAGLSGVAAGLCLVVAGIVAGYQAGPEWTTRGPWVWSLLRSGLEAGIGSLVAWSFAIAFRWASEKA